MNAITSMFSEGDHVSNVRVMSFICLCYTLGIHAYSVVKDKTLDFEVLTALLLASFAPKVIQKFAEKKV